MSKAGGKKALFMASQCYLKKKNRPTTLQTIKWTLFVFNNIILMKGAAKDTTIRMTLLLTCWKTLAYGLPCPPRHRASIKLVTPSYRSQERTWMYCNSMSNLSGYVIDCYLSLYSESITHAPIKKKRQDDSQLVAKLTILWLFHD